MKIEIDKDIVSKAILCEKNFDCLKNENHDFCKVEFSCSSEVHFINCLEDNFCVYKKVFGDSFYCSCPIRKEINNKYNI